MAVVRKEALQYLQWYGRLQASVDGAPSWWDTLVYGDQVYQECPGSQVITLSKETTYQALVERLGVEVQDRVRLGERVDMVRRVSDTTHEVETSTAIYQCDYVIVTVSLGLLKQDLIKFSPSLPPSKRNAIESLGFGVVTKVFLEYAADVRALLPELTDNGISFLRAEEGEEGATPWENLPSSPWEDGIFCLWPDHANPRLLTAWLQGSGALRVESMPRSSLLPAMTSFLADFLTPSHPFSQPISATPTTWGTESSSLGSYSYLTPHTPPTAPSSLAAPLGRLMFAGEATHSTHMGTVHGAVESGWREAERILGMLG